MNERTQIRITDSFEDEGEVHKRGSSHDFSTAVHRSNEAIKAIVGGDNDAHKLMDEGSFYYERGEYVDALKNFSWCLAKHPSLNQWLFYYIRICEKVLAVPLLAGERIYIAKLERYRKTPRWIRWLFRKPEFMVRCKWCGRYTRYINPSKPTFGGIVSIFGANNCEKCGRMYPMPSWDWDNPEGRAYSYYRMSFGNDAEFYREFEEDYDPNPIVTDNSKN